MKKILLILPLFLCSSFITKAQKKIEIIHADDFIFNNNLHPDYGKLLGNVSFKHEGVIMHCDSAYQYKNNKMDAFGNIKINQGDTLKLYGKQLFYDGNTSKAIIKYKVKLIDKHSKLTTEQINYDLATDIASYPKKGKIINGKNNLISNRGSYHSKSHLFYFKGNVEVININYVIQTDTMLYNSKTEISFFRGPTTITSEENIIYCENGWYNTQSNISELQKNTSITHKDFILKGDSIFYDKNKGYGKAIHNIHLIDTINKLFITGNLGEYFEESQNTIVTQNALLNLIANKDTLFIHADTLKSIKAENKRKITAYNNVKCYKSDMQAKCDSLSYNLKDSIIELFNKPIIWSNKFQITADSICLLVSGGKIKNMFLRQNPMIISLEDSVNYNQIKGKVMTGFFKENKLHKIVVVGGGQTIFLAQNDKKENIGINTSECSDITLSFKENVLDGITFHTKPAAVMHPIHKIEEKNKLLEGFLWRGKEQPKNKSDIFIE